jgi:hypothetical protein
MQILVARSRFRFVANVKISEVTTLPIIPDELSMIPSKPMSELFNGEISYPQTVKYVA